MKGEAVSVNPDKILISVPASRHRRQRLSSGTVLADDYSILDSLPLASNTMIVLAPRDFS